MMEDEQVRALLSSLLQDTIVALAHPLKFMLPVRML